jgi:hypothetical protein
MAASSIATMTTTSALNFAAHCAHVGSGIVSVTSFIFSVRSRQTMSPA